LAREWFNVARVTSRTRQGWAVLAGAIAALAVGGSSGPEREALPPTSPRLHTIPASALFSDDFSDGTLAPWRTDRDGVWTVRYGMLRADLPDAKQQHSLAYAGSEAWTNYAVDLDVCAMRGVDKGVVVRVRDKRGLGVDLRGPGYQDLKLHINEMPVGRVAASNGNGVWHHLRVEVRGSVCRVMLNGDALLEKKVSLRLPASGAIALAAYTGGAGECTVYYDNIVVTPIAGVRD
jgi:hypothetical protein